MKSKIYLNMGPEKLSDLFKVMEGAELGLEVMVFPPLQAALEKLPPFYLPGKSLQDKSGHSQLRPFQETGSFQKGHIRAGQPVSAIWKSQ